MGSRVLVDSPLLIDYLNGVQESQRVLLQYPDRAISIITWIEVTVGVRPEEEDRASGFLRSFEVIQLNEKIASEAVLVRKTTRLKLPDAIILATAHVEKRILLTRNTRDFTTSRFVQIPYKL